MNVKKHKKTLPLLLVFLMLQAASASPARIYADRGNKLYEQGKFDKAIEEYDNALINDPDAAEPKFNKANSYYRLDDLEQAMNLYRQASADSKNMKLVAKAKYNLGNTYFQQGSKQKDSNLKKAIEDMETAITHWRTVLDIEPENEKAAKNIEVARLTIKDILDQLKNQQDPNQPQDPNQAQQQQSPQQDPNQAQQQQGSKEDPNQPQKSEQQQQNGDQQQQPPDTTAQEILDKEQRDKKQRQMLQRSLYQQVDKDW